MELIFYIFCENYYTYIFILIYFIFIKFLYLLLYFYFISYENSKIFSSKRDISNTCRRLDFSYSKMKFFLYQKYIIILIVNE